MQNVLWFVLAAVCEIAGCYAAWMWLRLGRSAWWLVPGAVSLLIFAIVLTRVDAAFAGRAYTVRDLMTRERWDRTLRDSYFFLSARDQTTLRLHSV